MADTPSAPAARPAVSVVVPFCGSASQLASLTLELQRLELRRGDELIIANNGAAASDRLLDGARITVCQARGLRAPGFARNRGAELASGEWLLFIDADTLPAPTLIDDYFRPQPQPATGVLAGNVTDVAIRATSTARHGVVRERLSQARTLQHGARPYAQTANCAVLRAAFADVGGFRDEIRSGEDADLCFRLAAAGWQLEQRPNAVVRHRSRETVLSLTRQLAVHGSGAAWLDREYPGSFPAPSPTSFVRRVGHDVRLAGRSLAARDRDSASLALLDLAGACAFEFGRLLPNRARAH
jgi:GT2 family glycosyltransferase